ncbi:choice-of-anchor Q domain-containing protein [Merismopedia glauca]|uniref:Right handed beta helix domain-containing protein n=1 Tax=Merismopedia glauca CCAP 1448/3 TaxID=1296344 RepID=A0A2T1C0X7_9CYAN|nr:choice-of-anchor Q domain-containing protein [Merismopedia glauca]PSB01828.1 hypothetical protein C7B64_16320 [Merismopedia glauca CCAP 1448/3]
MTKLANKSPKYSPLNNHISIKIVSILGISIAVNLGLAINSQAAGVIGNGTPSSCTDTAINNALNGGGNVIFNCGNLPLSIKINSEKLIATNTVIDGRNLVTLDGSKSHRIFNVNRSINLTVKNLGFKNGHTTDQGAAINNLSQGTLTVSNCKFESNVSVKSGEYGGGAIYSGPLATLIVDKSTFTNNQGGQGGAIRGLNSNLTVTNSTFTGNKAIDPNLGSGGAIYVDSAVGDYGEIKITNSTFNTNSATSYGGAFFNSTYNANKTTIEKSKFVGNQVGSGSKGQGGAIWSTGDAAIRGNKTLGINKTTLTIINTTISDNKANIQGGGVWLARHPNLIVSNTTISGNIANQGNGGGLVLGDNGYLQMTNSTITNNKVLGAFALGGGIVIGSGKAKIVNSTISHNVAQWQGGGITRTSKVPQANVVLKNTIVANNTANNGGKPWNITHNCFNQMTNGGSNLQFPARNTRSSQDVDCTPGILTAEPKLDVLKNNGGFTLTRALLPGSAATGRGYSCPATDQRGIIRPNPCDIGAFEAGF